MNVNLVMSYEGCKLRRQNKIKIHVVLSLSLHFTLLYLFGDASRSTYISPSWLNTQGFFVNTVYFLSPMNLSSRFLKVFNVGAVTRLVRQSIP